MDTQPIQIRCACCEQTDTAVIPAQDIDALASLVGPGAPGACAPITLYAGPADCLDRECDEYATEDGDERDIDHCSHITPEQACETHSKFADDEVCTHAEPWPCQHATAVVQPARFITNAMANVPDALPPNFA